MNAILHSRMDIDVQAGQEVTTTRKGDEWNELVDTGDVVDICICSEDKTQHEIIGTAKILDKWLGRFRDIPARFVELDHVEEMRSYTSLFSALQRIYKSDFADDDCVTVLWYRRLT